MGTHTEVETFTITKGEDAPVISVATPVGRKMATVRTVDSVVPIEGADAIEVAWVGGWSVVVKKNEFKPGDLAIYCEIDSWIPTEIAAFLSRGKEPREYEGIKGEKLRTIRLRKQLSQGLLLPLYISEKTTDAQLGDDVTEALGIVKWEATLPACLQGQALGNFPSWIRKTDQERCVSGDTFVATEIGDIRMDALCQIEVKPLVLSYNHGTKKTELKKIISTSILPAGGRWLKITTKSGKVITVTDNHKMWSEDKQTYVLAGELVIGQKLHLKTDQD